MSDEEVLAIAVQWIAQATGLVVIRAHESGDRPPRPYVMVNPIGSDDVRDLPQNIEYTETEELNSEGEFQIETHGTFENEWELSIHSFGDDSVSPLRKIKLLYRTPGQQKDLL